MSEWLLFNANSLILQLYHGENKLIFNEMMMRSALCLTNTLCWMFIVLAHWNNSPRVDISFPSNTLLWFRANQSLLLFHSGVCLAKKQQILISWSLVWPDRGSNPRSTPQKRFYRVYTLYWFEFLLYVVCLMLLSTCHYLLQFAQPVSVSCFAIKLLFIL